MPSLPAISSLPTLPTPRRAEILDSLFEPSSQLHTLSIELVGATPPFPSYATLIAAIRGQLTSLLQSSSTSDTEWLNAVLSSHPRLGEKKVDSELSRAEQARMREAGQEEQGSVEEELAELNRQYEEAFPGLRYVVFVNGRSRHVIMQDMKQRMSHADVKQERADAVQAMCDIALDRVQVLGEEPEASSSAS